MTRPGMTEVTTKVLLLMLLLAAVLPVWAGEQDKRATRPLELYRQLSEIGLDPAQVYRVREAALDREDLHIALDDGIIVFTHAVEGKVTGAYFEGEGEVLLMPPDRVERASLNLFTGSAVLEEKFNSAYLRFNDDTFAQLQPALRAADGGQEFAQAWNPQARSLAQSDGLRLLASFLSPSAADRMLHARVRGARLGSFDVYFDSAAAEQISAGQTAYFEGAAHYDIWTSFSSRSSRAQPKNSEDEFRVSACKIRARVAPPQNIHAEAELNIDLRRSTRLLWFELAPTLRVSEVSIGGQVVEFVHGGPPDSTALTRRGGSGVAVVLPESVEAGRQLTLRFVYEGKADATEAWYPRRPRTFANFDLEFRYPAGFTLIASGVRTMLEKSGTEQTARWTSAQPLSAAGFVMGNYERASVKAGEVAVEAYASVPPDPALPQPRNVLASSPEARREPSVVTLLPAAPGTSAEAVAQSTARALQPATQQLGAFPFAALALAQRPGKKSYGWPGLAALSGYAFLTPEQMTAAHLDRYESLTFSLLPWQQATAQWFAALAPNTYRDQWLLEALAHYSALAQLESERPQDFRELMEHYRRALLRKNPKGQAAVEAGPVTLGARLNSSRFPTGYDTVVTARGAWVLHMLRSMLRDHAGMVNTFTRSGGPKRVPEPFFDVLRKLRQRFAGTPITTADVQQAFEEALPDELQFDKRKSLDWFFDNWVNGTALPQIELAEVKLTRRPGGLVAAGRIVQKDAPDHLVTSVPIYGATASGPVLLGRVFAEGASTPFRFAAPAGTSKLLLDPQHTVLTSP